MTSHPALVLNADFQPLSVFPLSVISWKDALKAVITGSHFVVAEYDRVVRSPSTEMRLPSVVALKEYQRPTSHVAFTRFNLFLRDRFECQYCGSKSDLTFDHLVPRSKGGKTTWQNVVAACGTCNLRKGDKSLKEFGIAPRQLPFQPTIFQLQANGRKFPPSYLHESWLDYAYWDAELQA